MTSLIANGGWECVVSSGTFCASSGRKTNAVMEEGNPLLTMMVQGEAIHRTEVMEEAGVERAGPETAPTTGTGRATQVIQVIMGGEEVVSMEVVMVERGMLGPTADQGSRAAGVTGTQPSHGEELIE